MELESKSNRSRIALESNSNRTRIVVVANCSDDHISELAKVARNETAFPSGWLLQKVVGKEKMVSLVSLLWPKSIRHVSPEACPKTEKSGSCQLVDNLLYGLDSDTANYLDMSSSPCR